MSRENCTFINCGKCFLNSRPTAEQHRILKIYVPKTWGSKPDSPWYLWTSGRNSLPLIFPHWGCCTIRASHWDHKQMSNSGMHSSQSSIWLASSQSCCLAPQLAAGVATERPRASTGLPRFQMIVPFLIPPSLLSSHLSSQHVKSLPSVSQALQNCNLPAWWKLQFFEQTTNGKS